MYAVHNTGTSAGDVSIYSWYELPMHNPSSGDSLGSKTGTSSGGAAPFIYWDRDVATGGGTIDFPQGYSRKITMIEQPSSFVALVECNYQLFDQNTSTPNDGFASSIVSSAERLAGRHGDALNNGQDGYTNFAFFDGHVSKFPTTPYSLNPNRTGHTNGYSYVKNGAMYSPVSETLFYLQQQNH